MRIPSRLTTFTLADGSTITTRSALETRWAVFFNELGLSWQYEPKRIGDYMPDFYVGGLGFVEIKPSLDLLISEASEKIKSAAIWLADEKIFVFVGSRVSFQSVALYHGKQIFAPTHKQMVNLILNIGDMKTKFQPFKTVIEVGMNRANRARLDHFVSVAKVIDHYNLIP